MRLKDIVNQSAKAFLFTNLVYVLNFCGNIVLIRLLLPEDFGLVAIALSLVGIVEIFTTFAPNIVLIQHRDSPSMIASIFKFTLLLLMLKIIIAAIVLFLVSPQYQVSISLLYVMIFLGKCAMLPGTLLLARVEKSGRFFSASLISGLAANAAVICAIIAVLNGASIYGLVLRETLPGLFVFAAALIFFRQLWPKDIMKKRPRKFAIVLRSSMSLYFVRASETSFMRLPLLAIDYLFGAGAVGLYSQSLYIVTFVNRITSMINQQVATVFFSLNRKDKSETRKATWLLIAINLAVGIPLGSIMFFFAKPLVLFAWGEAWLMTATIIPIMAVLTIVLPLFTTAKSRLYGLRKNTNITVIYVLGTVAFVSLLFYPLGRLDVNVFLASIATGSYILMLILSFLFVMRAGHQTKSSKFS